MKLSEIVKMQQNNRVDEISIEDTLVDLCLEEVDLIFDLHESEYLSEASAINMLKETNKMALKTAKKAAKTRDSLKASLDRGFSSIDTGSVLYKKVEARKASAILKINKITSEMPVEKINSLKAEVKSILNDVKQANMKDATRNQRIQSKEFSGKAKARQSEVLGTTKKTQAELTKAQSALKTAKLNVQVAKRSISDLKDKLRSQGAQAKDYGKTVKHQDGVYKKATRKRMKQTGFAGNVVKRNVKKVARNASGASSGFRDKVLRKVGR